MRIYHCHVENFGVLRDLDVDFRRGLHTFEEANGWGKSTLAAFLLVMFYGFSNEKSRRDLANERKRYAPWQQGVYGGTVTFSKGGKLFRLERVFGLQNAKEDISAVYDAETNLPVPDMPADPGVMLFSIDRDSFAKTVFIAQQDCGTEATPGIQAKIGHLEDETADIADYGSVQESRKKAADSLTPNRKTGELYRLRQKKAALEADAAGRAAHEKELDLLEEQLEDCTNELEKLRKETEDSLEEQRRLAVAQRAAEDLSLSKTERLRIRELDNVFREGLPGEQELEEAEVCLKEIRKLRTGLDRAERELYGTDREEEDQTAGRRGTSLISVLVLALFASALLAFFLNRYAALGLAVLAVVIMIAVVRRDIKTEKEEEKRKPVVVVRQNTSPITKVMDMRSAREGIKEKRRAIRETESELLEFLRRYYPELTEEDDLSRKVQQLLYEAAEYTELLEKEARAREAENAWEASVFEMRNTFRDNDPVDTFPPAEEPEDRIAAGRRRIGEKEQERERIRRQIGNARAELDRIAEEEEQLCALQEELEEKQHQYEILCLTREYLSRAREAFTARYMGPVQEAFDRYYRMLTREEQKTYQLDADLKITVREYGAFRDTEYLSEGWQDLIGLCRRMAMIEVMYEEEKPFLVFDDPFVNLDGQKLGQALRFLEQISETYQVIYFTCHESRVPKGVY